MVAELKRGRPKKPNSKRNDTRLRMTDEQLEMLNYCCEKTGRTKTDVMMLGLEMVYNELKQK